MLRRAADSGHSDVRQRRSRRRAMPVTLTGLDMDNIADGNLALLGFRCRKTFARRDHENLIAVVDMPAGRRADSEVNDVAAKIFRLPIADNRLPRPAHRPASPTGDRRRGCRLSALRALRRRFARIAGTIFCRSGGKRLARP